MKFLLLLLMPILSLIRTDEINYNHNEFTYVFVCESEAYVRLDEPAIGHCRGISSHPCAYIVESDLGKITSEEKLMKAGAKELGHHGCYSIE